MSNHQVLHRLMKPQPPMAPATQPQQPPQHAWDQRARGGPVRQLVISHEPSVITQWLCRYQLQYNDRYTTEEAGRLPR